MFKNKTLLLAFLLISTCQIIVSQNNTNSPYTRFGYGSLNDANSGEQRAMGGVGIGARSKTAINTLNPASYSTVDSMTFMFDVGVSALATKFSGLSANTYKFNSNLEYLTMQIPLWKNVGFSAGLLPYSFSGYNFYSTDYVDYSDDSDTASVTQSFSGFGGVNQVYTGISINLFKHLSLGVNAYYMFGSSVNYRGLNFSGITDSHGSYQYDSISVSSFRLRYGLQYFNTFNKKHDLSIGFIYEAKQKLGATYSELTGSVSNEVTPYEEVFAEFEMPQMFGVGLNYSYNKQLTLGLDYSLQQWANAKYMGVTDTLSNRSKLAFGVEYLPNPRGRRYIDHVLYRAGFNMSDAYYKVGGATQPKNFGITFGVGLPLKNNSSVINASFEYGKVGSTGLLKEDYFKFTLNALFNENWFFKRKL